METMTPDTTTGDQISAYAVFPSATLEMLQSVAALKKVISQQESPPGDYNGPPFDVIEFLNKNNILIARTENEESSTTYHLKECPFNSDHKSPDSAVIQFNTGHIGFKCFHDSCADKKWTDVRGLYASDSLPPDYDKAFEEILANLEKSDRGNGHRFLKRYANQVRYSAETGSYFIWNEKQWAVDRKGHLLELAGRTAEAIKARESLTIPPEWDDETGKYSYKKRLAHKAFGVKSEEVHECEAMLKSARAEGSISIVPEDLDRDPWLLNVANGTLNLKLSKNSTIEFSDHDPSDLCTKIVPIQYDPDAKCPQWLAFLKRVVPDPELRRYLQRAVGYTLTGQTSEQCFFFLYGSGANGKTTFIAILIRLLAAYHGNADRKAIMQQRDKDNDYALAELPGKRLVTIAEVDERDCFDEATIKNMTGGGDPINARSPYGKPFSYIPDFKLWLSGNHKPRINNQDNGIWRRPKLIPFTESIPKEEQDPCLKDKLIEELPGILAWAVRGCIKWQTEGGLQDPKVVIEAINEYRSSMDVLKHYLDDQIELSADAKIGTTDLYKDYKQWCQDNGHRPFSQITFSNRLKDRGHENKHTKVGNVWLGICLKLLPIHDHE